MLYDNASHDKDGNGISQVYEINTDGVFMTNPKNQYPGKKDVKFKTQKTQKIWIMWRSNLSTKGPKE